MKKNYFYLIFCCLLSILLVPRAQAQTNFRPGYVLLSTGDTLRGEVDSRDARASGLRCLFRLTPQAEAIPYLPGMLRGYGFTAENQYYRSLTLAVGDAAPQSYFFQVLVDGPASLYLLVDDERRDEYYVGLPNQPLALLKHGIVQVVRNNEVTSAVQTGYRNTLAAVLADCPVVQKQLPRLPFQQSQLIDIVATYNSKCSGGQPLRPQPGGTKSYMSFGIMAGVARQNLTYEGYPYPEGGSVESAHTGVAVGPVFKFSTNRLGQRFALVASILYEPEKYALEGIAPSTNGSSPTRFRQTFDLGYLRFPLMIRYTYPCGKVSPLAEAGISIAYAIKAKNTAEQFNSRGDSSPLSFAPGSNSNFFRSGQSGLGVGLGVETHVVGGRALAFLLRAERANGFSIGTEAGTTVVHFYGLLSIDLTK